MMQDREHIEQVALIIKLLQLADKYPEVESIFAIPNGGHRHIAVAAKLKDEGVKPGVPDLFLPVARDGYFGMFIEMKAPCGRISPEQKKRIESLTQSGYLAIVAFGHEDAYNAIEGYLSQPNTARRTLESDL